MPEMHLRQPGFTYSSCGPRTKKNKNTKTKKKKTLILVGWSKKLIRTQKLQRLKIKYPVLLS